MRRRDFIKSATVLTTGMVAAPGLVSAENISSFAREKEPAKAVKMKKALGYGMIQDELSLVDKFKMVKEIGFDGIEFNSPLEFPVDELLRARDISGIELPTTVKKDHWKLPLSSPDPAVRKKILESVTQSLKDTKAIGGDTVLVVPGVVNKESSYEEAYYTALYAIKELIPAVESTGVKIGLENVWNNFLLSPLEAKQFVDDINCPLIGWWFDIGNVLRYGWPEQWIKTLNKRIVKLHLKEFSIKKMNEEGLWKGFDVDIEKGDDDWPAVMKAVSEVGYSGGWITAEVSGGGKEKLAKLSRDMDKVISYLP